MKNPWKLTTAALGGLLVTTLVIGSFLLGRNQPGGQATQPSSPVETTASSTEPASSTPATSDPDATTGDAIPRGPVVAGKGGTPSGPGGLHLKYPRTPEGAVAAATNYYTAAYSTRVLHDATYRKQLAKAIAPDPATEKELLSTLDGYGRAAVPDATMRIVPERGAYAVASNAPDQMKIILWVAMCDGTGKECAWGQVVVVLVWAKEDWKAYSPDVISASDTLEPKDTNGIPKPEEKYLLLKNPPSDPEAHPGGLDEAYKLAWKEYANAAR